MKRKEMNITELRNELIDTFQKLKAKKIGISEADAVSNIAGKLVATAKVQLEYNRHCGSKKEITFLKGR